MVQQLAGIAARDPEGTAISDDHGRTTWPEANDLANRWVVVLRAAGLAVGDRVAAVTGNRRDAYPLFAACLHAGFVVVPVSWHLSARETAHLLTNCGARAVVVDPRYVPALTGVPGALDATVLRAVLPPAGPADPPGEIPEGFADAAALLAAADPSEPDGQSIGSFMFYTSGTTGLPKGTRTTLITPGGPVAQLQAAAEGMAGQMGHGPDAVPLVVGPVYHSVNFAGTLFSWLAGRRVALRHQPDPAALLDAIDAERVTHTHLVPTQFVRLLRLPEARRRAFDGASLRSVMHGGAPCPAHVKRAMIDWWGPVVTEIYGASEVGILAVAPAAEWLARPGTVGRVLPYLELTVVKDDGTVAAPGEEGLLYFRYRGGGDFTYHDDPDKTAAAHLAPGVFTVGDVGRVDDDGYLYLTDRRVDLILNGGRNVYPAEVEAVLLEHPAVGDAAVVGVPDPEYGERVHAVVEPAPGTEPGPALADELRAFAAERLAGYKAPRAVEFVDQLPRTQTGKVARRKLREPFWAGEAAEEGVDEGVDEATRA